MKNLKVGETVTNNTGDVWDAAILVVDRIKLDYVLQTMVFWVDIYKDTTARGDGRDALSESYNVDKATFLAEFDPSGSVISFNGQCEDYALTLLAEDGVTLIYNQFE